MPVKLNSEEDLLNLRGQVVLFAHTSWCEPCHKIKEQIPKFEEEHNLEIYEINLEMCHRLPLEFEIRNVPYLAFLEINDSEVLEYGSSHTLEGLNRILVSTKKVKKYFTLSE